VEGEQYDAEVVNRYKVAVVVLGAACALSILTIVLILVL
jgi:hypothetical protein